MKPASWLAAGLAAVLVAVSHAPSTAQTTAHSSTQGKAPIKVGAISSARLFPESVAAVKAYFDTVNAAGGIQGRPLQLITEDDQADVARAAAAARRLVEAEQVVAQVGSASALECAVNGRYYEQQGIVSIQGTGVDPVCFNTPNISPVNAGPYLSTVLALQFLTELRGRQRVCVYATGYAPVQAEAFNRELAAWSARTGRRLTASAIGMAPNQVLADKVRESVDAGCEGVVYAGIEAQVVDWMAAVGRLKAAGIDWVFLTPAYTAGIIERLGPSADGMFAMSEFEPWSSRSGMLTDWRDVMTRGHVPRTSLSQGGYAAALVFVRVLRAIKGEIHRASVTRAFKELTPQKLPMLGTDYEFGPQRAHASNRAAVPVQLQGGRWTVVHWDFIVAPRSGP